MLTGQLGRLPFAAESASSSNVGSRAGFSSGQRFWSANSGRQGGQAQWPGRGPPGRLALQAAAVAVDVDARNFSSNKRNPALELQASGGPALFFLSRTYNPSPTSH